MKYSIPKVSIIIPVYNVSQYLRKGLDSVVNQTLQDIEIIIVNDCSPDPEDDKICQEYANKDSRIVYIKHKKNLGLGGARNTGIKIAKAEYIGGVDSDDWIELNMYESLYNTIIETQSDIVCCGYTYIDTVGKKISQSKFQDNILQKSDENDWDIFNTFNPSFWNKLWKKSLFIDNNIFFPEQIKYEDTATTPRLVFFTKKICYTEKAYYNYLNRQNGITRKITTTGIQDYLKVFEIIRKFLIENNIYQNYTSDFIVWITINLNGHISENIKNRANYTSDINAKQYLLDLLIMYLSLPEIKRKVSFQQLESLMHFINLKNYYSLLWKVKVMHDRLYYFKNLLKKLIKFCLFITIFKRK